MRARFVAILAALSITVIAVACSSDDPSATETPQNPTQVPATSTAEPQNFTVAFSDKERETTGVVAVVEDLEDLVAGNNDFALDLYGELADSEDGNLFMSPYSISLALAMAYAGAGGGTADEMAETLGFTLPAGTLHNVFNVLDQQLANRGADLEPNQKFTLEIANSIWGQDGFEFEPVFLDTLAENYGAGMRLVDYVTATEAARLAINGWVEDNTNDRIKDLIPPGVLNPDTVLVLANAIFFKAAWSQEFNPDLTADADFTLLNGSTVTAELMQQTDILKTAEGQNYSAIEIPYIGGETSMVVVMPDEGEFENFEASLDDERLAQIIADLARVNTNLKFPKFTFESKFRLPEPLKELGMRQAFDPLTSDFSAMRTPPPDLVITDVIHQSFVAVDEQGTEAAAATAVIIGTTSAPPPPVPITVDRPFIFLIRDIPTDTILFMGRLLDPTVG